MSDRKSPSINLSNEKPPTLSPVLLTPKKREEMRKYRERAVEIELKLAERKQGQGVNVFVSNNYDTTLPTGISTSPTLTASTDLNNYLDTTLEDSIAQDMSESDFPPNTPTNLIKSTYDEKPSIDMSTSLGDDFFPPRRIRSSSYTIDKENLPPPRLIRSASYIVDKDNDDSTDQKTPPRLIRQGSYILDTPSKSLLNACPLDEPDDTISESSANTFDLPIDFATENIELDDLFNLSDLIIKDINNEVKSVNQLSAEMPQIENKANNVAEEEEDISDDLLLFDLLKAATNPSLTLADKIKLTRLMEYLNNQYHFPNKTSQETPKNPILTDDITTSGKVQTAMSPVEKSNNSSQSKAETPKKSENIEKTFHLPKLTTPKINKSSETSTLENQNVSEVRVSENTDNICTSIDSENNIVISEDSLQLPEIKTPKRKVSRELIENDLPETNNIRSPIKLPEINRNNPHITTEKNKTSEVTLPEMTTENCCNIELNSNFSPNLYKFLGNNSNRTNDLISTTTETTSLPSNAQLISSNENNNLDNLYSEISLPNHETCNENTIVRPANSTIASDTKSCGNIDKVNSHNHCDLTSFNSHNQCDLTSFDKLDLELNLSEEENDSDSTVDSDILLSEDNNSLTPDKLKSLQELLKIEYEYYIGKMNYLKEKQRKEREALKQQFVEQKKSIVSKILETKRTKSPPVPVLVEKILHTPRLVKELPPISDEMKYKLRKLPAFVRGYLTRRLIKTETYQEWKRFFYYYLTLATEIQNSQIVDSDTLKIFQDYIAKIDKSLEEMHNLFFKISTSDRMKIISKDRDVKMRRCESRGSNVSSATIKARKRRELQAHQINSPNITPRSTRKCLKCLQDSCEENDFHDLNSDRSSSQLNNSKLEYNIGNRKPWR